MLELLALLLPLLHLLRDVADLRGLQQSKNCEDKQERRREEKIYSCLFLFLSTCRRRRSGTPWRERRFSTQ